MIHQVRRCEIGPQPFPSLLGNSNRVCARYCVISPRRWQGIQKLEEIWGSVPSDQSKARPQRTGAAPSSLTERSEKFVECGNCFRHVFRMSRRVAYLREVGLASCENPRFAILSHISPPTVGRASRLAMRSTALTMLAMTRAARPSARIPSSIEWRAKTVMLALPT